MANYKIKYSVLFKAATICLVALFFTNTVILAIADTLSPRVGNPEVYQEMRGIMEDSLTAQQKPLPIQPNLILAINLSDIGAKIEGGRVVCDGDSLNNVEGLIPLLAKSGVGRLYLTGGLYKMSELSKKVHDNPAHNNDSRVITSGKATVLVRNYPTQRKTVGGIELKDEFGNPFSNDSMKLFNPHLSAGDAREHFRRVVKKAHQAGMKIMVDFVPWPSPDSINEKNLGCIEHKELDDSDKELFRNMPELAKEAWLKGLLERPENNAYFAVEPVPGRIVLGKHVASLLGTNFDQAWPNLLNEDLRRYYIESLKGLIDLGVDSVRVDLAFYLLIEGLPDEKQPLKIIIDAAKDYARSKGQEMAFALEAYGDEAEQKWLIRLGADHVYSMLLFETYWNIVRNNGNAGDIKDAVWHALFTEQKPLIFPSNFDQTALTAIGGGTKGFAMLLMAIGQLRKATVWVMFDLRDWLLHHGYLLKMPPGGSPDPYDKSQHLFVTEEELKIWTDFSKIKYAITNAPLKKVMQDFYNSVRTNEEQYIESPGISHPDKLFPLCWKTENGDWTMLVVNFKPSGGRIQARVDLPEEIKGAAGVVVNDMLNRGAAAHVEGLAGINVDFKPQEEYKIYTIKKPASIWAPAAGGSHVSADIENTQYLVGILPPAAKDESGKYVIRYNEKSLQDYEMRARIGAGTLGELLNAYVDLLRVRLGGKDRIKLQPSSSTDSKRQPLISAEYYHGPNKTLIGKGHVDIEGEELEKYSTLRILEMANIAFAIANIPIEQMPGELDQYNSLILFIQNQYKGLTGKEISLEEILRPDRIIILPPAKSIPPEKLREYYELTVQQLRQAA